MAARTALFSRNQPGGVFTIDDAAEHPGDIYFVDSTHAAATNAVGGGKSPDKPLATLDYAIGLCTASKGDVIYLMPGHAETTTAIALDVAGVRIIGLGWGRIRPTLTADTTAGSLLTVSAANCEIHNVRFVGAASGNLALLDLAAADFVGRKLSFEHGAAPLIAVTVSAASHRFQLLDCQWLGTANGPDTAINVATKSHDWVVKGARFLYGQAGIDNELIKSAKANLGYIVEDWVAVGVDTLIVNLTSSSAGAPDGMISDGRVMYSAAVTSIEDGVAAATSKGAAFGRVYASDVTGKSSGLIPLTTAS